MCTGIEVCSVWFLLGLMMYGTLFSKWLHRSIEITVNKDKCSGFWSDWCLPFWQAVVYIYALDGFVHTVLSLEKLKFFQS